MKRGLRIFAGICTLLIGVVAGCAPGTRTYAPVAQPSPAAGTPTTAPATGTTAGTVSGEPVRVGLNTEITGAGALTGDLGKKAAEIAIDKVNREGGVGGRPLEMIVEDAQSTNQGALAALNKAAGEDRAFAMVGPVKSTQILAIEPRIRELEMPSFVGGTNPTFTQRGNPWLFRLRPTDAIAGPAIAKFLMEDLKLSKIGILHDSDAFGTTGADLVEKTVQDAGKQVVRRESYKTGDKDYTAQLLSLRQAGAEALVLYGTNSEDDSVILRQTKEQGLQVPVIGSPSYGQTILRDLASEAVDGVYAVIDYFPGRTPESNAYMEAWRARYNSEPDGLSAWNWDAMHIIRDVYPKANGDKRQFRDEVLKLNGYKGAVGTISFDANGDGLHSVDVVQYKGAELQFIRTVSPG